MDRKLTVALIAVLSLNLVALMSKNVRADQAGAAGTFAIACAGSNSYCVVINTTSGAIMDRGLAWHLRQ